jgi:hypothetical protein
VEGKRQRVFTCGNAVGFEDVGAAAGAAKSAVSGVEVEDGLGAGD